MDFTAIINSGWYTWLLLPLFIFFMRVIDVSMGTIRVIFISKGFKFVSSLIGFFEIMVWLLAIRQIMTNLDNWICFFAYAGGFATGTFVGVYFDEKISIGKAVLRIFLKKDGERLVKFLEQHKYHFTTQDGQGRHGKVKIILMVLKRQEINLVLKVVRQYRPDAFYTIEDVRFAAEKGTTRASRFRDFFKKGK